MTTPKTPTTRLEILQWLLAEPGREAEATCGTKEKWFLCSYSQEGNLTYWKTFGETPNLMCYPSDWTFRMLPENLPKRVPFEEVDEFIEHDFLASDDDCIKLLVRKTVTEAVTQALEQMREELKK